jgi:hypothetical protein
MIFDTADCGRRQGSALRSNQRAKERAPLTAVLAGQTLQLSGAKERKTAQSRTGRHVGLDFYDLLIEGGFLAKWIISSRRAQPMQRDIF